MNEKAKIHNLIGVMPPSLNPDKQEAPHAIVGSQVACQEYVRAMLRYLPHNTIGMFVPEARIPAITADYHRFGDNEGVNYTDPHIYGLSNLPFLMKSNALLAFHDVTGPFLQRASYLRAQFAGQSFPATGLIHGLSPSFNLWDFFVRLLSTPNLSCDAVICTSQAARDACVNLLERAKEGLRSVGNGGEHNFRLEVIPLGVDTELYRLRDQKDCRRLLGLPQNKTLLLYFGRIDAVTKADPNPLLLTFAELVRKHGNSLTLVLAGNTSQNTVDLLNGVAGKLGIGSQVLIRKQPGIIEGPLYYGAADLFVSPVETLQESFGITPLEAMASGLPVVVSDWSGYRDTVAHGRTGFRVKTYWADCNATTSLLAPLYNWEHDHLRVSQTIAVDTDELYQYLDLLVSNPDLRCTMGRASREHMLQNFHWQTIMERTYALWQELGEIARTLPPPSAAGASLVRPDYFHDFKHYASRTLDETTTLQITERGRNAKQTLAGFLVHPQMQSLLNPNVMHVILRFVKAGALFRQPVSLPDVADRIAHKYRMTPELARTHVMWLVKYGFLRAT